MRIEGQKNNNNRDFKELLINSLSEIKKLGKSALGGNSFDDTIFQIFEEELKPLKFTKITAESWSRNYPNHKKLAGQENFDFSNVAPLFELPNDKLIVDKPNGSQMWPDILVINNKIGTPFEIKSGKDDKIVWNSGLPKEGHIYIFGSYKMGCATFFLGESVINRDEITLLTNMDGDSKNLCIPGNKLLKDIGSKWQYYSRPMFNSNEKYFGDANLRNNREQAVIDHIKRSIK